MMMFVTYDQKNIHADLSHTGEPFAAFKRGTIIAFLDSRMNLVLYCDRFDELSTDMYKTLDAESQLSDMPRDALVDCNLFSGVDILILRWMKDRLLNENVDAKHLRHAEHAAKRHPHGYGGAAAHRVLTIIDDDHALADDMPTIDLKQREAVLQKENASVEPSSTMTSRV